MSEFWKPALVVALAITAAFVLASRVPAANPPAKMPVGPAPQVVIAPLPVAAHKEAVFPRFAAFLHSRPFARLAVATTSVFHRRCR